MASFIFAWCLFLLRLVNRTAADVYMHNDGTLLQDVVDEQAQVRELWTNRAASLFEIGTDSSAEEDVAVVCSSIVPLGYRPAIVL